MVGSIGNLGTIHSPPRLPPNADVTGALLALAADPARAAEARAWVEQAKAALAANEALVEQAKAALAEAQRARREADDALADVERERSALKQEQAEERQRREAVRSTQAKETERLDAWGADLRAREAACGKLADRLARASAALSEWQEGAKA